MEGAVYVASKCVIRVYLIYVLADMVQGFGGFPATSGV